ncbi:genetic competence negative regulator [Chengkuizengella axinellae]|uniref:Genetic competence negative regulator n=1 Tax=Chengkuizengella axinellae TaxID=3064388 RepID=A0ABT9IWP4_9BACL|nr:genetic competence negative regulator [Chengkuizengella sp. 2205SS18-9]MDP5273772.1 genetic competence negative regulator [Chengkuizengella sp. 2205SS18-9]
MKMERLSTDKIRIYLTFEDLNERGIQKEDMWREIPKVRELFNDMMEQAYSELGFEASGPLAVEVITHPAQGMIVIVTKGSLDHEDDFSYSDEEVLYEMEVTMEQSHMVSYTFLDFEHVITVSKLLKQFIPEEKGTLYSYEDQWILQIDSEDLEDDLFHKLIALLSEYGEATSLTQSVLEEYGKTIIAEDAIKVIDSHF